MAVIAVTDSGDKNSTSKDAKETPAELSTEPVLETVTEVGAVPEIKNLYEVKGKASCSCCITWATEPQKKPPTTATADTDGYAILARKTEGHGDFGQESKLHSIVIQSPLIKEVLNKALKGYPGITPELKSLTVEAPFSAFYHRWEALTVAYSVSVDDTAKHLGLLIHLLKEEFRGMHEKVADLRKNKVIEYRYIWAIFEPEEYIFTQIHGQDAVLRLEDSCSYDETQHRSGKGWTLRAKHIDYNGSMTGFGTTVVKIPEFKGTMPLTELRAYPLDMHQDKRALVDKMILQGKRFAELREATTFQEYGGIVYTKDESGYKAEIQVSGRVIVDSFAYCKFKLRKSLSLRALDAPSRTTTAHTNKTHNPIPGPQGHIHTHRSPPPPPPPAHQYGYDGYLTIAKKARPDESEQTKLSDEQLLICLPFVRGYSFKNKEWVLLNIEFLRPVQWTEDLFENLVLPTEEKGLLLALARSHSKAAATFDDFVVGKGKGMIILLDGPPGVGKTLTAESLAEVMRAPLYTMSAGELGTQDERVERRLSDILEMATMWNAILLIDEADVFMEERSVHDLERNELVSIFLRHLEYFQGVMILTTNRVKSMDPAFDSRADVRLHYADLDTAARRKVWANFVAKLPGGSSIDEQNLNTLAERELNGRQIKSAMKMAYLLASGEGTVTGFSHVETVLRVVMRRSSELEKSWAKSCGEQ